MSDRLMVSVNTQQESADGLQTGRLLGLSWLHFLNDGSGNYLPGVLPAVLVSLHQSVALAGVVMGALLVGQTLQLPAGWIEGRIGGRMFIVWGMLGVSVAASFIGLAGSLSTLIPALIVIGICSALFHPQALAAARHLSGKQAGIGMSIFLVGGEIGRGVWPLVASFFVVSWGRESLAFLALPALMSAVFLWRALPLQPPQHKTISSPLHWRAHLPALSMLVGFQTMRALAIFGVSTFMPVLWHVRGRSLTEGAALITVLLVVGVIGNLLGGHLSDKLSRRTILCGASSGSVILLTLFLLSGGVFQWVVLGVLGIFLFVTQPVGVLIGQEIFPHNRSLGSGIALGFSNGLAAMGIVILGLLIGHLHAEGVLWALVGGLGIAAMISSSPLLYPKKIS